MTCFLDFTVKFLGLTLLLINPLRISCIEPDEDLLERVAYSENGTYTIAALFSVHQACSNLYYPKCGLIQDQAGMQRVEAALWEIDLINKQIDRPRFNHTFGLEIRDTCGSYVYAFQQGLSIHNSVTNQNNKRPMVGAVGPAFSAEIRITHEWLNKTMPQVGFSATSPRMTTKKENFLSFARVVPPDNHQARLIVDLLNFFGQKVVNSIITAGVYGSDAIKVFKEAAENASVCVGSQEIVYDDVTDAELEQIFINSTEFNRIVVCFCEGRTVRKIYRIAERFNLEKQLLFISSDGWTEIDNVTQNFKRDTFGSIMINTSPQLKIEDGFTEYYENFFLKNLSQAQLLNGTNPWREEFYKYRFDNSSEHSNKSSDNYNNKVCSEKETLPSTVFRDPKLSLVRYSIRVVADSINHYLESECTNLTTCELKELGPKFMNFTKNNPIKYGVNNSKSFRFDDKGDPADSSYEILSYGKDHNGNFTFQVIGNWSETDGLKMDKNVSFVRMYEKYKKIRENCTVPCPPGKYKLKKNCCWTCTDCNNTSVPADNRTRCKQCSECQTPNSDKTECVDKKNNLIKIYHAKGHVCIFISLLGAVLTSYTAHVFYKNRRTPIVKFSSTHLSYIIFCGMGLAYSCTLLNIKEPNFFTCTILRFAPSISLTMIYGPILMKTNRISRALSAAKKRFPTLRMKYLSAAFLVTVSLMFVLADFIVCTVELIIAKNRNETEIYSNCTDPDIKIVFCPQESNAEFIYRHLVNVFLLIYCASYAYRSGLHLPDNFNETKFVIVSCACTAVVWAAFLAIFLLLQDPKDWANRTLALSLALSLSSLINLVCMYFPKLYVILYRPKKNHRAFYSTVTEMRCYFGNTESRCRGYSSVNMDSTAGDPGMITGQNIKKKEKNLKRKKSDKTDEGEKKSRSSKCGANRLMCTCGAIKSMSE